MSGFRVRVDLSRFFKDERAHCWVVVPREVGTVSSLQARLAALCGGALRRRRFVLVSDGHWLPETEDLAVVQPGDRIVAIPLDKEWDVDNIENVCEIVPNTTVIAVEDATDHAPPNKKQKTNSQLGVEINGDLNNTMNKETTRNKKKKSRLSDSATTQENFPDWNENSVKEKSIRKKKRQYKEWDEFVQSTSTPVAVESQTQLIAICKSKQHKVFREVDEVDASSVVICDSSRGDTMNDIAVEMDISNGAACDGEEVALRNGVAREASSEKLSLRNGVAREASSEDREVVKTSELEDMKRRALQLLGRVASSPPARCASSPAPRTSPAVPHSAPPAARRRRVRRRRRPRLDNSCQDLTDDTDRTCSTPLPEPGGGGVVRNVSAERRAPRLVRPLPPAAADAGGERGDVLAAPCPALPAAPCPALPAAYPPPPLIDAALTAFDPDVAAARILLPNTTGAPETLHGLFYLQNVFDGICVNDV